MATGDRLLVFDIGNVLVRFSEERATRNYERLAPGRGAAVVHLIWHHRGGDRFESGHLSSRGFHALVCRRIGQSIPYRSFRDAFLDIFTPIRENLRLLGRLSRRHPTALLSNTNPLHWRFVHRHYPVLKSVRWRFASHLLGLRKPQKILYRRVAQKTGIPLSRMIYIDDHADFIAVARKLGMTGIVFDGRRSLAEELKALGVSW